MQAGNYRKFSGKLMGKITLSRYLFNIFNKIHGDNIFRKKFQCAWLKIKRAEASAPARCF
jgi:hypothetical protein